MMSNVNEVFTMLKKYRSGVVITKKINSPTYCLDFDQSINPDSKWYNKGRLHNRSPYISSITEIIKNVPEGLENDSLQSLRNAPRNAGLPYTPSTQYFLKEDHLIMIFHKNRVTSYPYTERAAKKLGVSVAPALFKGELESEEHLESIINEYKSSPKATSDSQKETSKPSASLVVRALGSFRLDEYNSNVFEF